MNRIEISAGSRLHFGLLCGPPNADWHYGGLGLMLQQPKWNITVAAESGLSDDVLNTSENVAIRTRSLLAAFRELNPQLPPVSVTTRTEVAGHSGLGSGTQLTLCLGAAFTLLAGKTRPENIDMLATSLGRSRRSAIGTFGFDHGGFVVDEGRHGNKIRRISFPDEWRMVLLTPATKEGLSGNSEEAFFDKQDFLPPSTIARFDGIIRQNILPALENKHLPQFRDALADYGELVGQFYATAQGGIFSDATIRTVVEGLKEQGITGAVQSSWGPTVCIPAASDVEAQQIRDAVSDIVSPQVVSATIAKPLNTGATIKTVAPTTDGQRSFG